MILTAKCMISPKSCLPLRVPRPVNTVAEVEQLLTTAQEPGVPSAVTRGRWGHVAVFPLGTKTIINHAPTLGRRIWCTWEGEDLVTLGRPF